MATNDVTDAKVTKLRSLMQQMSTAHGDDENLGAIASSMMASVTSLASHAARLAQEHQLQKQRRVIVELSNGFFEENCGGIEGGRWVQGLSASAKVLGVLRHAEQTVLRSDGPKLKTLVDKGIVAVERFAQLSEMHETPIDWESPPNWLAVAREWLLRGRTMSIEDVILVHIQNHSGNPVKLRNLVRSQTTLSKNIIMGTSVSDRLYPAVASAAESAEAYQLALE